MFKLIYQHLLVVQKDTSREELKILSLEELYEDTMDI